jgi:hypothetical protein
MAGIATSGGHTWLRNFPGVSADRDHVAGPRQERPARSATQSPRARVKRRRFHRRSCGQASCDNGRSRRDSWHKGAKSSRLRNDRSDCSFHAADVGFMSVSVWCGSTWPIGRSQFHFAPQGPGLEKHTSRRSSR